jgi:hypothetical protein
MTRTEVLELMVRNPEPALQEGFQISRNSPYLAIFAAFADCYAQTCGIPTSIIGRRKITSAVLKFRYGGVASDFVRQYCSMKISQ